MHPRKQRLQERIDAEITPGTKLAARSVRIGPSGTRIVTPNHHNNNVVDAVVGTKRSSIATTANPTEPKLQQSLERNNDDKTKATTTTTTTTPIMGMVVVERKQETNRRRRSRPPVVQPQPQQQQQQHVPVVLEQVVAVGDTNTDIGSTNIPATNRDVEISHTTTPKMGFPSMQQLPLGTFLLKANRNKTLQTSFDTNFAVGKTDTTTNTDTATMLLQQMSIQEIQESIHELHMKLKPETIQFLKHRQQFKQQPQTADENGDGCSNPSLSINRTRNDTTTPRGVNWSSTDTEATTTTTAPTVTTIDSKMQMAQIMSSIQSYDDLDTAYNEYIHMPPTKQQQSESPLSYQNHIHDIVYDTASTSTTTGSIIQNDNHHQNALQQFHLACTLLRSTSLQQTIWASRIVCHTLRQEYATCTTTTTAANAGGRVGCYNLQPITRSDNNNSDTGTIATSNLSDANWPYPILLPVSLRCLLDAPMYGSRSLTLQGTYVLQSIYRLLQLRACPDHVIHFPTTMNNINKNNTSTNHTLNDDITTTNGTVRSFTFQIDCLSDVIPSVPVRYSYAAGAVEASVNNTTESGLSTSSSTSQEQQHSSSAAAYWTSDSSSKSAEMDGQAFIRDPMWTLLSRMRIIPRMAQILQQQMQPQQQEAHSHYTLPIEARQSICGILAMIGQRSPGAATAIVHHPTLLQDLLAPTFLSHDGGCYSTGTRSTDMIATTQQQEHGYDPRELTTVLFLLCTLSRQSRVAAEGIHRRISISTDDCPSGLLLHILLLLNATNLQDSNEITNYSQNCDSGTLSDNYVMQQWTIILWRTLLRYGFGLDMLPTMLTLSSSHVTLGLHDASLRSASLAPEWYTCYAVILHGIRRCNSMDDHVSSLLSSSTIQRQSIYHLREITDNIVLINDNSEVLRLTSAIFMFWSAVLAASDVSSNRNLIDSEIKHQIDSNGKVLLTVFSTLLMNIKLKELLMSGLYCTYCPDFNEDTLVRNGGTSLEHEAQTVTFLEAVLDLTSMVRKSVQTTDLDLLKDVKDLEHILANNIISGLDLLATIDNNVTDPKASSIPVYDSARRCWLNRLQASIITFLCRIDVDFDKNRARRMAFAVLGRLEIGEESVALMLLEIHELFHPSMSTECFHEPSPISALLLQELCMTPKRRRQLQHNCNLRFNDATGSDITLDIQSLLHDTGENGDPSIGSSDDLLPIGKYWIWKLLAGNATRQIIGVSEDVENVSPDTLTAALKLIDEMEAYRSVDRFDTFGQLSNSVKLYYFTNICFQGEIVLSNDDVRLLSDKLFEKYFYSNDWGNMMDLANECQLHLDPKLSSKSHANISSEEEQVKAILDPTENNSLGWSTLQIRSIETYIGDLCDLYMDFGVQYDFFTKSVRLFLAKEFPTKVRLNLLNRLRSTLHLLSLQDDDKNIDDLLVCFLTGGMPSYDQSVRDDPELIDGVVSFYVKGSTDRPDDKFVKLWATCVLARSLAISIETWNPSGLHVAKRRICGLEATLTARVVSAAQLWLKTDGSVYSLVAASKQSEFNLLNASVVDDIRNSDDSSWEKIVSRLKSTA